MMDIESLAVCMADDRHLLSEAIITETVVKAVEITALEVIASAPGCDCK